MSDKLGEILLRLGYIKETDIDRALEIQHASGGNRKLGEILSEFILREEQLVHALSIQKGGYAMDAGLALVSRILRQRLQQQDIVRILRSISAEGQEEFISKIADILDKIASFIEISQHLSDELSLDALLRQMIIITAEALNAERSTLFLNDRDRGELFSRVTQGGLTREIRFPNHLGIAGAVFTGGQPIIIPDAYSDPRFNKEIDKETGYKTKNILCAPIKSRNSEIIGAIQLLNKKEGDFSTDDLTLLEAITSQASAALQNAQLFEAVRKAREEETQLLDVTTAISSELQLEPLLMKIMETTTDILNADRSTLFLHDEKTNDLWSLVAQGTENRQQIRFPSDRGIAGSVFVTGLTINIPEAYADTRFNKEIDKKTGYHTQSILCMPIVNKKGTTIGVTQVLNKKGGPFTDIDEKRLKAFSAQVSIAIENAKLFDDVLNMKNYNESILESMSNGVITLEAEDRIVKCNAAALRILGMAADSLAGSQAGEFFTGKSSWIMEDLRRVSETGKPSITLDTELFLPDGRGVSINLTVVPLISVKGVSIGSMLVFEDITKEKRIKGTMARYMTKEIADKLLEGGEAALGGQIQEATVFFSDIRSFTSISEKIGAQQTVSMLNEYFTLMVDIIFQYNGILDKYIGDAILAVFGVPFSSGQDADNAVKTAIDMMRTLNAFNLKRLSQSLDPVHIGMGINTAEILAGNIGSLKRMDYTVIGDGVNLAARLEGANKYYGTKVLVSEFTFKQLKGNYLTREIDLIRVKGKSCPVGIFEVLDYHDARSFPHINEVVDLYREGFLLYRQKHWMEAIGKFEEALVLNEKDSPSRLYIERCRHFIDNPPESSWDCVWTMKEK